MKRVKRRGGDALAVSGISSSPDDNDDWSDKIDHLKLGYETAQGVIEFIDAKGNILIGLSTVVAGFGASLIKWSLELPSTMPASWENVYARSDEWAVICLAFVGLSLGAYVAVVLYCLFSVIARKAANGKFTLLFPVPRKELATRKQKLSRLFRRNAAPRKTHQVTVEQAVESLNQQAILDEYSEQLAAVGRILERKLNHNRWASVAAVLQLVLLSFAIGIYFGIACDLIR